MLVIVCGRKLESFVYAFEVPATPAMLHTVADSATRPYHHETSGGHNHGGDNINAPKPTVNSRKGSSKEWHQLHWPAKHQDRRQQTRRPQDFRAYNHPPTKKPPPC